MRPLLALFILLMAPVVAFSCKTQHICHYVEKEEWTSTFPEEKGDSELPDLRSLKEVPSPDGRLSLICEIGNPEKGEYAVYVLDNRTSKRRHVYVFCRYVQVQWSPDSRHVILNDHNGGDFCNCYILCPYDHDKLLDLDKLLNTVSEKDSHYDLSSFDETGMMGLQWLDNRTVEVYVRGKLFNPRGEGRVYMNWRIQEPSATGVKIRRGPL